MVPVLQAGLDDCLRAVVASILHLKLEETPHFIQPRNKHEEVNEDWFEDLVEFFFEYSYRAYWTENGKYDDTGNYSIGYGYYEGDDDWPHVVVCYDGKIVHNPSDEITSINISDYINLESL